jgi:predicted molibdopterin-dependent oxidoreductase YjgC
MGALPDSLPGYHSVEDAQAKKKFADRWDTDLPGDAGLTAIEMINHAREAKIKGMYIVGENPVLSFPNPNLIKEALASLDFLVVQDVFLTETAKLANVVLPAASFAEKEGTFTNFEGRVQQVRKVIEPLGGSLPDWEIVLRLAKSMGSPMPYSSLQQVMDEIQELVPLYQGTGYRGAEAKDIYRAELDREPLSNRRLYKGQFPSGFGRFSPVQYEPLTEMTRDGYSLTLLAGSVLYHSGTGSRSSRAPRLSEFSPEAYVEIGEADAGQVGISQSDDVKVISPAGEVTAVARFTDTLPEGIIFMPISFPSTPVNQLFGAALDPRAKTPALKACAVKLERI